MLKAAVQQSKAMEDSRMEKEVEQMLIKVATSMEEEWALKEERLKRAREKEREYWEHLAKELDRPRSWISLNLLRMLLGLKPKRVEMNQPAGSIEVLAVKEK